MDNAFKIRLADYCEGLATGRVKPTNKKYGICHAIYGSIVPGFVCVDKIQQLAARWPKYSGVRRYPVPSPHATPRYAYIRRCNMWDRRTQYGRNRRELCQFIADELRKEVG